MTRRDIFFIPLFCQFLHQSVQTGVVGLVSSSIRTYGLGVPLVTHQMSHIRHSC